MALKIETAGQLRGVIRAIHTKKKLTVLAVEKQTGINHRSALRILTDAEGHRLLEVDMVLKILALYGNTLAVVRK
jgi:hypothetical protein